MHSIFLVKVISERGLKTNSLSLELLTLSSVSGLGWKVRFDASSSNPKSPVLVNYHRDKHSNF